MRLCLLLVALALAPGCTSERSSPECKDVCHKHARCVDQTAEAAARAAAASAAGGAAPTVDQNKFDQSECIEECTSLRRDAYGATLVQQHITCVEQAKENCTALLACP